MVIRKKLAKQRAIAKEMCETAFAIKLLNKENVKKKSYDKYKSVNAIDSVICDIDCKIANLESIS